MKRSGLILLAILILAIGLRWWHIGKDSFWYDEFGSLEVSSAHDLEHFKLPRQRILHDPPDLISLSEAAPIWKIWTHLTLDMHPPLFFMMLRLWRDMFGTSEVIARTLTALAGIAGVICIYDVARLAHNRSAGLWAALIFAVAGPQVLYAQETRGYTFAVLWGLCMLDAIVRIAKLGPNWRRLLALGAAELAIMLTHYIGIPLSVALGLYTLICMRGPARWKSAGTMIISALIFCAIWGKFIIAQRNNIGPLEQGFLYYGPWSPWYSLQQVLTLPVVLLGPPVQKYITSTWISAIVYVLPLLLIRKNRFLLLWLFWLAGTVGFLGIWDRVRPSHELSMVRYVLICGPGFYLIYAGLLSQLNSNEPNKSDASIAGTQRVPENSEFLDSLSAGYSHLPVYNSHSKTWMQHLLPALVVIFCCVSLPASLAERMWPDWRKIAHAVDEMKQPGDLLVCASEGKDDWFSGLYMEYAYYAKERPRNVLLLVKPADEQLMQQIKKFSGVVVINGTNLNPEVLLPGYRVVEEKPFLPVLTTAKLER